ncbi:hypothetical protein Q5P01_009946 [Channa striata]|uniref:Uncharacterized protein n=1 Tax=Channa striata TaxID=64152 RepID=A0AA88MXR7_CHASR|nr:hypothetical protein Q5P01_009946 [Channa striata]
MAKDMEQPVTAGEAKMGTVGEQRAITCPEVSEERQKEPHVQVIQVPLQSVFLSVSVSNMKSSCSVYQRHAELLTGQICWGDQGPVLCITAPRWRM